MPPLPANAPEFGHCVDLFREQSGPAKSLALLPRADFKVVPEISIRTSHGLEAGGIVLAWTKNLFFSVEID